MLNEQLAARIQAGIDEADNMLRLWQQNEPFIRMMGRRFAGPGKAELEDLMQEGYLALCEAVRHYDMEQEVPFISYAAFWIKQGMKRYIETVSYTHLVAFGLPFSILVLTNFMRGVNRSLEEAALVDGANYVQIYWKVMLPMTKPAIATVSIFNFLNAWNNVIFPLIFIKDNDLKPVALGILNFNGERGTEYGLMMAAIVITVALPMFIYMLFQEKVEGGLAAGAVKE